MVFFERLLDFISTSYRSLIFWYVLNQYETGVVLRLGRYNRKASTGLHLKWPLAEKILKTNHVLETLHHYDQQLTTQDGSSVCLRLLTAFTVSDAKTFLLDVDDAESVLSDSVMNESASLVRDSDYAFVMSPEFDKRLMKNAQDKAALCGIEIKRIGVISRFKYDAVFLTKTDS